MIYTTNPIYGKVWKILKNEQKYMDIRMTTSVKDSNGEWVDSNWFPRLMGHAFNALKDKLKEGDKIVITKAIIENPQYTAQDGSKKSSFKFRVLEASIQEPKADENTSSTADEPAAETGSTVKEESPW